MVLVGFSGVRVWWRGVVDVVDMVEVLVRDSSADEDEDLGEDGEGEGSSMFG